MEPRKRSNESDAAHALNVDSNYNVLFTSLRMAAIFRIFSSKLESGFSIFTIIGPFTKESGGFLPIKYSGRSRVIVGISGLGGFSFDS